MASLSEIEETLNYAFLNNDNIILVGDVNTDLLEPQKASSRVLLRLLTSMKLKQVVDEPTRFHVNSSTLIDVICLSCDFNVD